MISRQSKESTAAKKQTRRERKRSKRPRTTTSAWCCVPLERNKQSFSTDPTGHASCHLADSSFSMQTYPLTKSRLLHTSAAPQSAALQSATHRLAKNGQHHRLTDDEKKRKSQIITNDYLSTRIGQWRVK